jgi:DNA-binding FadR family transcriptional regulator
MALTLVNFASESLASRTARDLGQLSLQAEEGAFLGSEDELLARFGVSRPTLRQAAKIAENDRLISIRRGVRGGFYAARPDASDAVRSLARFLRLQGATMQHILAVNRLISEEAAALAAASSDAELRQQLIAFAEAIDAQQSAKAFIRAETQLAGLIASMSGNPVFQVVMGITYSFGLDDQNLELYRDEDEREQARKLQRGLVEAILDRDPDVARLMMRRRSETMARWVERKGRQQP